MRGWSSKLDLLEGSTHTHTIPVRVKATVREGHGKLLQPNISIPSTTLQKPFHESSMSQIWLPETMMNGKFPVQKIQFDHPSVSLGDQFVCEVLHNNSFSTSGPAYTWDSMIQHFCRHKQIGLETGENVPGTFLFG